MNKEFLIFTKVPCVWCESVKSLIEDEKDLFETKDLTDKKNYDMLMELESEENRLNHDYFSGRSYKKVKTVPQVFLKEKGRYVYIGGYMDMQIYYNHEKKL